MHWVFVNHRYHPFRGGSEQYVQVLAEDMARRGQRVTVVTSNAFDLEAFWDQRKRHVRAPTVERINGVTVRRVPIEYGWNGPLVFQGSRRLMGEASRVVDWEWPFRQVARRLPRLPALPDALVADGRPDIVFAANLGLESLPQAAVDVSRKVGAAFVLMPLLHLGVEGDPIPKRYVSMPHQRRLLREADLIFAMTEREAAFITSLGVSAKRIATVGVGVDQLAVGGGNRERFREQHGLDGFVVGAIGALAPDKGTLDLVRAAMLARAAGDDLRLVLAGPELGAFSSWWRTVPARQRRGIQVLGVISDAEKRDMLAAIDVLALPSRTESFGIVFLEAWANRLPVIAADAGAVPEIVQDGVNGLLTPFGAPECIAEALHVLKADPAQRARMGQAGEQLLEAKYTWPSVLARMAHAYERVLGIRLAER